MKIFERVSKRLLANTFNKLSVSGSEPATPIQKYMKERPWWDKCAEFIFGLLLMIIAAILCVAGILLSLAITGLAASVPVIVVIWVVQWAAPLLGIPLWW